MQMKKILITLLLVMFAGTATWAQSTTSKGLANIALNGPLTPQDKQQAMHDAGINALDRYFSQTNQAKAKNYQLIRDEIVASSEKYILSVTILSEDIDGKPVEEAKKIKSGLYTLVVRAELNLNRLNNELKSQSVAANTSVADRSLIALIFVARQKVSVQSFDDKIYKRTDVNADLKMNGNVSNSLTESEDIGANSVTLNDSQSVSRNTHVDGTVAITSGGSKTTKADVVKWDLTRAADLNKIMTNVFTEAGYEVVRAEYLEEDSGGLVDLQAINGDYRTGDDLSPATLRNTAKGVKAVDIRYLALGTLDVGMQSRDPASGLVRVFVKVTGEILDLSGRYPRTASAVGPIQVAGLGPDESVARTNALNNAAKTAAKQLTDQLNAKGFQ